MEFHLRNKWSQEKFFGPIMKQTDIWIQGLGRNNCLSNS
jgi:hypothetical protein